MDLQPESVPTVKQAIKRNKIKQAIFLMVFQTVIYVNEKFTQNHIIEKIGIFLRMAEDFFAVLAK